MPEVSVVIPCFNCGKWIGTCLSSALAQTGLALEVIVVDDGSSDNSMLVAEGFARSDQRVRLIQGRGRGVEHARNLGVGVSRARWIAFLDADDWWELGKLEKQWKRISSDASLKLIGTYGRYWSSAGSRVMGDIRLGPRTLDELEGLRNAAKPVWMLTPSVLIERAVFERLGGFDPAFQGAAEDLDLWTRVAYRYPATVVQEVLTNVRISSNSTSMSKHRQIQLNTEWIRANLRRGMGGLPALNRVEFEMWFNAQPNALRSRLERKWRAEYLFRVGGHELLEGRTISAARYFVLSGLTLPGAFAKKLRQHFRPASATKMGQGTDQSG
jgi:glycosyltransferase involved in cell wall biosynthesis